MTALLPGLALCAAVSGAALALHAAEVRLLGHPWLEPLVLAILLGAALRTAWAPGPRWQPGIAYGAKMLLEVAVALLGASLSLATVWAVGPALLVGIAAVVALALASTYAIGRALRLPRRMAVLVACGNAICGNSAIAAVAPIIGADSRDVASSIAFTAVLGVGVVLGLPLLSAALGLSVLQGGALAGLTVYAVPQVLAATAPLGVAGTQVGTVVKLVRVLMLGPLVLGLSLFGGTLRARTAPGRVPVSKLVPWFIVAFLVLAGLRSLGWLPPAVVRGSATAAGGADGAVHGGTGSRRGRAGRGIGRTARHAHGAAVASGAGHGQPGADPDAGGLNGACMTDEPQGFGRGLTNYGDTDFARFLRRSFARSMGLSSAMLDKPVVGIVSTPSGFNNCHRGMDELVEAVSRGVLAAGALPRPFPTISLGEVFLSPTSMVYRNLAAMDTEEMIAAQPMDAVVLVGGCDKTVPAQLMGAASANIPAIQLVTGPMSTGRHRGQRLGACTDCRSFWARYRAGTVDTGEIQVVEGRLATTAGTCAVMGTASTMACIAEALGMSLPGTAAIPAVHADRLVAAEETGRAAVALIASRITPREVITSHSVENALRVLMAVGGSTNAVIHLAAIAGRLGIRVAPERLNAISDETPVLVDLKPVGDGYMEDFHAAGGVGAVLRELRPLLHTDTMDVEGRTLDARLDEPPGWVDRAVIRPFNNPVSPVGGLVMLRGTLAPDGAVFKRAAATPALFEHEGRAVVFTSLPDLASRLDDPALDVHADDAAAPAARPVPSWQVGAFRVSASGFP